MSKKNWSATTIGVPNVGHKRNWQSFPHRSSERKWPGTHSPMASGVGHVGCHLTYIIFPQGVG